MKRSASAPQKRKSPGGDTQALLKQLRELTRKVESLLASGRPPAPPVARPAARGRAGADGGSGQAFGWLNDRDFESLASLCQARSLRAGQALFAEGEAGEELYLLREGLLEIFKKDFLGDLRIAEIRPGGMVGEMALIEGKPRSANVRAALDCEVLALSRDHYLELKARHPEVAIKLQDELLLVLSNRLRDTTEKMMGKLI